MEPDGWTDDPALISMLRARLDASERRVRDLQEQLHASEAIANRLLVQCLSSSSSSGKNTNHTKHQFHRALQNRRLRLAVGGNGHDTTTVLEHAVITTELDPILFQSHVLCAAAVVAVFCLYSAGCLSSSPHTGVTGFGALVLLLLINLPMEDPEEETGFFGVTM